MQIGCAVIFHNNSLLLLKKAKGSYINFYEFPGGKREEFDTSIQECIKREVLEEINCKSSVGELIYFLKVDKKEFNTPDDLHVYFHNVSLLSNDIKLSNEHSHYIWTSLDNAENLDMLKSDYQILKYLKNYYMEKYF